MVCVYSHWVEDFLCHRAAALAVAKVLLEKIIPNWGIPSELHGDKGIHFIGQIIKVVCRIWPVLHYFHCTYHPNHQG